MDAEGLYDAHARERLVAEPPKRVEAPERTPFERDRARVVHAAAFRRLAAKTQVVGPETDDFVRNRLTHSLEVAQVARDLSRALGSQPDIAETAALAHDLGHPPFGHNGERALAELSEACGGFEGNAQTLRLLTRLEAKTVDADGRSVGLNLTRATLDACCKYPWPATPARHHGGSSGCTTTTCRSSTGCATGRRRGTRQCLEAQVMDLADDVAYSVHDVEDGIVAGRARAHRDGPRRRSGRPSATGTCPTPPTTSSRTSWPGCGPRAAGRRVAYDGSRGGAGRAQEPHQRPDRPVLRGRPGTRRSTPTRGRSSATRRTWSCPSGPGSRSRCSRASRRTTSCRRRTGST